MKEPRTTDDRVYKIVTDVLTSQKTSKPPAAAPQPAQAAQATPQAAQRDERELRDMLRKFYLTFDDDAFKPANVILGRMADTLLKSKDDVQQALGQTLRDAVLFRGAWMARTHFGSAAEADPSYEKPIAQLLVLFGEYYLQYRILKVWIGCAGRLPPVKFPFHTDPEFRRLIERDKQHRDKLRDVSAERRYIKLLNYRSVFAFDEDLDVLVRRIEQRGESGATVVCSPAALEEQGRQGR